MIPLNYQRHRSVPQKEREKEKEGGRSLSRRATGRTANVNVSPTLIQSRDVPHTRDIQLN